MINDGKFLKTWVTFWKDSGFKEILKVILKIVGRTMFTTPGGIVMGGGGEGVVWRQIKKNVEKIFKKL